MIDRLIGNRTESLSCGSHPDLEVRMKVNRGTFECGHNNYLYPNSIRVQLYPGVSTYVKFLKGGMRLARGTISKSSTLLESQFLFSK